MRRPQVQWLIIILLMKIAIWENHPFSNSSHIPYSCLYIPWNITMTFPIGYPFVWGLFPFSKKPSERPSLNTSAKSCHSPAVRANLDSLSMGIEMGMGQNPIPLVNIKIAGKWMFIPLKMVFIGIDPYPNGNIISNLANCPLPWFFVREGWYIA